MNESQDKAQEFSGQETHRAPLYMSCAELQNRRLQVRFLSHLP